MARLHPKYDAKNPKMNVPKMDPRLLMPPSHDTSWFDNGPVVSGVSSVSSTERAGLSQPATVPCASNTKLAVGSKTKKEWTKLVFATQFDDDDALKLRIFLIYLQQPHKFDFWYWSAHILSLLSPSFEFRFTLHLLTQWYVLSHRRTISLCQNIC